MSKSGHQNIAVIRWLTFLMFMMFAMTTDSVGVIILQIVKEFSLSLTAAGAFHYATMAAIAVSAALLGFLADRFGRKQTIVLGLTIFAVNSYLFVIGDSFAYFLFLLTISGASIGIFKTGALALIGDIIIHHRTHLDDEPSGGVFRCRCDHRSSDRYIAHQQQCVMEVALFHRRDLVCRADSDCPVGSLPADDAAIG